MHQLRGDFFSSQALLKFAEWQSAISSRGVAGGAPSDDFSVKDRVAGQGGESGWQFGEGFGDVIAGARKNSHFSLTHVNLCANAVVLVFDGGIVKIT